MLKYTFDDAEISWNGISFKGERNFINKSARGQSFIMTTDR